MTLALCVNHQLQSPTDPLLARLPGVGLRVLAYDLDELDGWLAQLDDGRPVFVTLNNECRQVGSDWRGWDAAVQDLALRFGGLRTGGRVVAVGCGNELDIWHLQPPGGNPDPRLTPAFAADLANRALRWLAPEGIATVATSVASGTWYAYLEAMAAALAPGIAVDVHPYGKRADGWPANADWGDLEQTVRQTAALSGGRAVYVSEGGIKLGDAGGEAAQAEYVTRWVAVMRRLGVPFASYFALYDHSGAPHEQGAQAFGLVASDGRERPALKAFIDAAVTTPPEVKVPEFILGIKAEAERLKKLGIDVGVPLEHETYLVEGAPYSLQFTTKGYFMYSRVGHVAHFFKAEGH